MKTKTLILIALPLMALGSCTKKDSHESVSVLDGTYTGKFIETLLNEPALTHSVQFALQSGKFNTITRNETITTGDGTFKVSGQSVNFNDIDAFPANTSINSDAALTGSYNYAVKNDSVFLTKKDGNNNIFSYKLKKH